MNNQQLKSWATATRAAYRQCLAKGCSRRQTRNMILAALKRQGWDKFGVNRAWD